MISFGSRETKSAAEANGAGSRQFSIFHLLILPHPALSLKAAQIFNDRTKT
jgi:hypothetical protein